MNFIKKLGLLALVIGIIVGCAKQKGCTEPNAINYDSVAEENDGSCIYADATTDTTSTNSGLTNTGLTGSSNQLTDVEGNTYKIVTIGNQTWMAENLKTTKYSDGTAIELVTNYDYWEALVTGAYCYYNNDNVTYKNKFGALYNSYAVNTGKLCPTGWHVPSYDELKNLVTYVETNGHQGMEGSALKSSSGWDDDYNYNYSLDSTSLIWITTTDTISGNGTDYFGWNGLAGGVRDFYGDFDGIGEQSNWWSSTDESIGDAWVLYLETDSLVDFYGEDKEKGAYVRCLKD